MGKNKPVSLQPIFTMIIVWIIATLLVNAIYLTIGDNLLPNITLNQWIAINYFSAGFFLFVFLIIGIILIVRLNRYWQEADKD